MPKIKQYSKYKYHLEYKSTKIKTILKFHLWINKLDIFFQTMKPRSGESKVDNAPLTIYFIWVLKEKNFKEVSRDNL